MAADLAEELGRELATANIKLKSSEERCSSLNGEITELKAQLTKVESATELATTDLNERLASAIKSKSEAEKLSADRECEVSACKGTIVKLEQAITKAAADHAAVVLEITEAHDSLTASATKCSDLKAALAKSEDVAKVLL